MPFVLHADLFWIAANPSDTKNDAARAGQNSSVAANEFTCAVALTGDVKMSGAEGTHGRGDLCR